MILLRSYRDNPWAEKEQFKIYLSQYKRTHQKTIKKKPAKGYVSKTNSSIKTKK